MQISQESNRHVIETQEGYFEKPNTEPKEIPWKYHLKIIEISFLSQRYSSENL